MNKTLSTILIVLAIVILAGGIFFAGTMYARSNMMFGWNGTGGYGSGMMGQGGMMNGQGGMMNGYGSNNSDLTSLTIEQAKAASGKYLSSLNTSGLSIGEVMIFDNHAYVLIKESDTGLGAFELLVDPASQAAYPEHGPNMMWNLKYSLVNHDSTMGGNSYGMMNGYGSTMMQGWASTTPLDVSAEMTITPKRAVEYAQQYLDANFAGATTEHPMQFYGYYTLDFEKDGKIVGMLSVNGYSGQVFLHTWHGTFIEETEYE
jgi:hypothetical protein